MAVIWTNPTANIDFFLGSQVWIESSLYKRRPGCTRLRKRHPSPANRMEGPHSGRFRSLRRQPAGPIATPYRASSTSTTASPFYKRPGRLTHGRKPCPHKGFAPWKRLRRMAPRECSAGTMLRSTCEPSRLLDLIENFLLFAMTPWRAAEGRRQVSSGAGRQRAIDLWKEITENRGRLGVFWHTRGSRACRWLCSPKVLRRLGGNWTFVIITDRQELDDRIAGIFASVGNHEACQLSGRKARGPSARELLAGQNAMSSRIRSTSFRLPTANPCPALGRNDIIVITDEAHRNPNMIKLAANMRRALPNLRSVGFTSTPLIAGQEGRTREVFGVTSPNLQFLAGHRRWRDSAAILRGPEA